MNNCSANQVVVFGAGTFNVNGNICANKGIVLRGQGPNSTTIVLNGGDIYFGTVSCGGLGNEPGNPGQVAWTGGLTAGSTQLTVSSTANLHAGATIIIDEHNPSWIFTTGNAGSACPCGRGDNPPDWYQGGTRAAPQMTKIVSVDDSTHITIRDPVAYTHVAGNTPQVFYWSDGSQFGNIEYAGVEDVHIAANRNDAAISFVHCDYCWVKNVWIDDLERTAVLMRWNYGGIIRDSYFAASLGTPAPTQYGLECFTSSNVLTENNIVFNVTAPVLPEVCFGMVYAYNYLENRVGNSGIGGSYEPHQSHNFFHLSEGNDVNQMNLDNVWGSSSHMTFFRNRSWGTGNNKLNEYTESMRIQAHQHFVNAVANVLGDPAINTIYKCDDRDPQGNDETKVWDLGGWNGCGDHSQVDSVTRTSMMRWGNWDSATWLTNGSTNGIRYCTSNGAGNPACTEDEQGDSDPTFPALSNPSTTFPASFIHTSQPSFFTNSASHWPPVGPDVSCSSNCVPNTAGHAYKIPARLCYEAMSKDGSGYLTAFDPKACYGTTPVSSTPMPPATLAAF
jgi:hypothetical protein